MPDTYTKSDLEQMKRADLRHIAVQLGLSNQEVSQKKSAELIGYILDSQDSGGKSSKGKAGATKGRRGPAPKKGKEEPEEEEEGEEDEEGEEETPPARGRRGGTSASTTTAGSPGLEKKVDALGKELDVAVAKLDSIMTLLADAHKRLVIQDKILGYCLSDIWDVEEADKARTNAEDEYNEEYEPEEGKD